MDAILQFLIDWGYWGLFLGSFIAGSVLPFSSEAVLAACVGPVSYTHLAFYRMDESMVTDYPQVNTSTRIATLEPDKYPMAGMTSHKVTVGIYNPATQKTVYLKAGDPTDRYFTNICLLYTSGWQYAGRSLPYTSFLYRP